MAAPLAQLRRAELIKGLDADAFFSRVHHSVQSLETSKRPHPLSVATAIATTKRWLAAPEHRIELRDLVHAATEKAVSVCSDTALPCSGIVPCDEEHVLERIGVYEAAVEVLSSILATGCYWGGDSERAYWVHALERMAGKDEIGGIETYVRMRRFPALVLLYAGGIAAVARPSYHNLQALLSARIRTGRQVEAACEGLHASDALDARAQKMLSSHRNPTAVSEHLFGLLREPLREYLPDNTEYESAFERFECIAALVCADRCLERGDAADRISFRIGRFVWNRVSETDVLPRAAVTILEEAERMGGGSPLVQVGLIGGGDRLKRAAHAVAIRVRSLT